MILSNVSGYYAAPTTVNAGGTLSWWADGAQAISGAATIELNNGGTLENISPANWTVLNGAVTVSGATTINQTSDATSTAGEGLYLEAA